MVERMVTNHIRSQIRERIWCSLQNWTSIRISGTIVSAATSHTRKATTVKHRRYAPATPAWQQYLPQLHHLGSRICAGFISLAAEFALASSAWQQHWRRLHQLGSSICASFISLAAALAPASHAWQQHMPRPYQLDQP